MTRKTKLTKEGVVLSSLSSLDTTLEQSHQILVGGVHPRVPSTYQVRAAAVGRLSDGLVGNG